MGTVTVGQAFSWSSPALPKITDGSAGFTLTQNQISLMLVMLYAGCLVSPIPSGYIMDGIGRKMTCIIFSFIHLISWIQLALTSSVYSLSIARFLHGIWCGVVLTVMPVYLSETVHPRIRGSVGSLFGVGAFIGSFYQSLVGIVDDYKWLNWLNFITALILTIFLIIIPESPYFNLIKGEFDKAKLNTLRLMGSVDESQLQIRRESIRNGMENKAQLKDLFKPGVRHAFLMVIILLVVQRCAGMSLLLTYTSLIVPDSFVKGNTNFILLSLDWIIFGFVSCFIVRCYGRRSLFIFSCAGAGLTSCVVCVWLFLDRYGWNLCKNTRWLPLIVLLVHGMFYGLGLASIPLLIQGELFPVNVKALASAIASMIASITSGMIIQAFFPLTLTFGVYSNFILLVVAPWLGALYAYFYMIETKGKTLEEIQTELLGGVKKQESNQETTDR